MADFLRKVKLFRFIAIFNILALIGILVGLFVIFMLYYASLPTDSPLRARLQLGKKLKVFEIAHIFYDHRRLGLPIYDLQLSKKDIKSLMSKLPGQNEYLTEDFRNFVPAVFSHNGKTYKVDVRIRGLLPLHWQGNKKSWKVAFKKNDLFFGKKEINLTLPEDRFFLGEHFENYLSKKLGLLTTESQFVLLRINGKLEGVYFEIEEPTKYFLQRKFDAKPANLYKDTDFGPPPYGERNIYQDTAYWKKKVASDAKEDYSDLAYLLHLISDASQEKFEQEIEAILDVEKFLTLQAIWVITGDFQWDRYHNGLFYFNPLIKKFEPLRWDFHSISLDRAKFFDRDFNPLVTRLLKSAKFLHRRNQILWFYLSNPKHLQEDLKFYDQTYKQVRRAFYVDRNKELTNWAFNREVKNLKKTIINNSKKILDDLAFSRLNVALIKPAASASAQGGSVILELASDGFSAVSLEGLSLNLAGLNNELKDLAVYFDKDNSGFLDSQDELLGSLSKINAFTFASKEGFKTLMLFPGRDANLQPARSTYRVFLVSLPAGNFEPTGIRLDCRNAITHMAIAPVYHYINEGYFKQISKP